MNISFENVSVWFFIFVFATAFVTNILWALYIKKMSKGHYFAGAVYSAFMGVLFLIVVRATVKDNILYDVAYITGLFFGTWWAHGIEEFFKTTWYETKIESSMKDLKRKIK